MELLHLRTVFGKCWYLNVEKLTILILLKDLILALTNNVDKWSKPLAIHLLHNLPKWLDVKPLKNTIAQYSTILWMASNLLLGGTNILQLFLRLSHARASFCFYVLSLRKWVFFFLWCLSSISNAISSFLGGGGEVRDEVKLLL